MFEVVMVFMVPNYQFK